MTPKEIRNHATNLILGHARDVEFLSISEHLEDLDLPEAEHDEVCKAIDEAIREATVTVEWPSGRDPVAALRDLAAKARADNASETAFIDALDAVRVEALRGPWMAIVADEHGSLIDDQELDEYNPDGLTVQIVRGTAAPGTRPDGDANRLPGTYASADHLVTFDDFDDPDEVRARWIQARVMVTGLNDAATEADQ